MVLVSQST